MKNYNKLLFAIVMLISTSAESTSFDCKKASSTNDLPSIVTQTICLNQELSDLDDEMVAIYSSKLNLLDEKDKVFLTTQQVDWVNSNNECITEDKIVDCLKTKYSTRIDQLNSILTSNVTPETTPQDEEDTVNKIDETASLQSTVLEPELDTKSQSNVLSENNKLNKTDDKILTFIVPAILLIILLATIVTYIRNLKADFKVSVLHHFYPIVPVIIGALLLRVDDKSVIIQFLFFIPLVLSPFFILYFHFYQRCPECFAHGSRAIFLRDEIIGTRTKTKTVKTEHYSTSETGTSRPSGYSTREVPYTEKINSKIFKCGRCGHIWRTK